MKKKKVLIICYNTLHNDPRVLRQIDALKDEFHIVAAGYSNPNRDGVDYIELSGFQAYKVIDFYFEYPVPLRKMFAAGSLAYLRWHRFSTKTWKNIVSGTPLRKLKYYLEKAYWSESKTKNTLQLKDVSPDLIIANDIESLPVAIKIKGPDCKLVFDAHEYHPLELNEVREWRRHEKPVIDYFCKLYLKTPDLMITVSQPIADEYHKNFGVKPIVVTNAPPFQQLEPRVVGDKIRLIHHGGAVRHRLLEETINVMNYLDDGYTIDLMLVPSHKEYLAELKEKYKHDKRISFVNPVSTAQISGTINAYDLGVYILPPLNFNNINALPNKFFEFVQGRLAIAIGPMPAMAEIVHAYGIGIVAKEYTSESLADEIKRFTKQDIYNCKKNSDKAAHDLCSEHNMAILRTEIKKILK